MFRPRISQRTALVMAMVAGILGSSASWALNPSLDISQHGHHAWRKLNGFALGSISAIAQTTDGYLWLATPSGLLRFDGVRGVPVRPATGTSFNEGVRALRGARDGTLWIGTSRGLFLFRNGSFQPQTSLNGMTVNAIDEDSDGTIWAAGARDGKGLLCTIRRRGDECQGQDGRLGSEIVALHRDRANALWVVGVERAWKWGSDPMVSFALPDRALALRSVTETADGAIVIGLPGQVARIANGRIETLPLPSWTRDLAFDKVLRDRRGSLWLGAADSGLLHLHQGRLDTYATQDGLSGDKILDLFEDREGNVWVSTSHGLDQFRPIAAANESGLNGLKGRSRAVLRARDGSLWAATTTGIYQRDSSDTWKLRRSWLAGVSSLFEDHRGRIWAPSRLGVQYFDGHRFVDAIGIPAGPIDAMTDDAEGDLWLAHRELGLLRVQTDGKAKFATKVILRPSSRVSTLTVDAVDHSLWVGLWSGALEKVRDGQVVHRLALLDGHTASSPINHIRAEPDGTLWVSTFVGLYRIAHGRVARLSADSGLSCDRLFWSFADERSLWLNAQCGLIRVDRAEVDVWTVAADKGIRNRVRSHLLDHWDGVALGIVGTPIGYITDAYNFTPKIVRSTEGRLWVVTGDSVVTIDPKRIPANDLPPSVHIELLISDGKSYASQSGLKLPPLQRNLEFEYTGLSFVAPERVQFRYKLEGRDTDWQDAGNRRQAFYTDLAPGPYRFRVTAANASGVWNETGATLEFVIPPTFVQTGWFIALCAASVGLLIWFAVRFRVRQVSARMRDRFSERMAERERIARELHDTLLQSTQGLILRFQAVANRSAPDDPNRSMLNEVLDRADTVLAEGRDRVLDLRVSADPSADLPDAFAATGQELTHDLPVKFRTLVEGKPRTLQPVAKDEIYRVGREALINAFKHSRAGSIEIHIIYADTNFRVRVRDDGRGVDESNLTVGRDGHFGLLGMRERAKRIGAQLDIWSRPGAGTEIELKVPAASVYVPTAKFAVWRTLRRLAGDRR